MGAKQVVEFAKKCGNLQVLVHVSTGDPCSMQNPSSKKKTCLYTYIYNTLLSSRISSSLIDWRFDGFNFALLAYVSGEKGGLIHETPYKMGDTLNGAKGLDIDAEGELVAEKLQELRQGGASDKETMIAMKELGLKRLVDSSLKLYTSIYTIGMEL